MVPGQPNHNRTHKTTAEKKVGGKQMYGFGSSAKNRTGEPAGPGDRKAPGGGAGLGTGLEKTRGRHPSALGERWPRKDG